MMGMTKPLLATLQGTVTDRVPFWLMRQAGRYLPEYRAIRAEAGGFLDLCLDPVRAATVTLQPVTRFETDGAILFADILILPYALGQPVGFLEGEGPKLTPIRSTAEITRLDDRLLRNRMAPIMETVQRVRVDLPSNVTFIGFAGAPWTVATYMVEGGSSRDFEATKSWAFGDPAGFQELIDRIVAGTIEYLSAQIVTGVEVVQLFDSWAGALSGDAFEQWVIEPTRQITEALKQRHPDTPVIGFPRCAGPNYLSYVAKTGVDAVGLDTGLPLDWVRHELQSQLPVQGNLDPILLAVGGPALDRGIDRVLTALSGGPLVFNLGHGVVPWTPPEHVAQLSRRVRNYRRVVRSEPVAVHGGAE
jgi:uroporphyrinogen decarboxylase